MLLPGIEMVAASETEEMVGVLSFPLPFNHRQKKKTNYMECFMLKERKDVRKKPF